MNPLAGALAALAALFDERATPWALVGGLAVSSHVDPRFTRDIDVAVAAGSDVEAEDLVHAFVARGYVVRTALEQEAATRLAAVRLVAPQPCGQILVDLLFASSGIEPEVCDRAIRMEIFPGVRVPVAGIADLIAMKVLSADDTRPQDALDLRALLGVADAVTLAEARAALRAITARGFHRQRNLDAVLARYL